MDNKDFSNSENLYVKIDENNLIYLDPNTVVVDNTIQPRSVNHEDLVMYVNLEADLIPRSRLALDNGRNTIVSISKGSFNMLRSQTNGDKELTTDWTESYVPKKDSLEYSDSTGQSFGIESISINVKGASFIPQVDIMFVDVRGKTLFESPEKSPYKAFFHIPWPIFYLTVKGYYGKAIRYRLHLVKLNTTYNSSNGNFETSAKFVGSTFAYMNDIPLKGILNAPYMFVKRSTGQQEFNEETGITTVKVFKSSKGYAILKSVYDEMKIKKYIPESFPVITLRELGHIAGRLDSILEKKITDEVADPKLISALKDYGNEISELKRGVLAWRSVNLRNDNFEIINSVTYYRVKNDRVMIQGENLNGSLEIFLSKFNVSQEIIVDTFNSLVKNNKSFDVKLLSQKLKPITDYFYNENGDKAVAIDKLLEDIDEIEKVFIEQENNFNTKIEEQINIVVRNPLNGFGFDPTVRNLFAVLLANAEVYIRLMKDTHDRAFAVGNERKQYLSGFEDETGGDPIYPWPEIKVKSSNFKDNVIIYPGDQTMRQTLRSDNATLWPEVEFVEEFLSISTNIKDPLTEKEGGVNDINYIFVNDLEESKVNDVSALFLTSDTVPYINRTVAAFIYEIYERAKALTLVDSLPTTSLINLVEAEFETIRDILNNEHELTKILKDQIRDVNSLRAELFNVSPYERYEFYKEKLATTEYIKNYSLSSTKIEQYDNTLNLKKDFKLYDDLKIDLRNYKAEKYRYNIYPFNSDLYLSYINKKNVESELNLDGVIGLNQNQGYLTSTFDTTQWLKEDYALLNLEKNLFTQKLKINENFSTNILNTPYFHKQLYYEYQSDKTYAKFVGSSYLLLNSLPFYDLHDIAALKNSEGKTSRIRLSTLFKELGSTHFVPYLLVLKWGSIYHRYKKSLEDNVDILKEFLTTNYTTTNIDGGLFFNENSNLANYTGFTSNGTTITYSGGKDIGAHPFYDAIFHEIINGYTHYNVDDGNESFSGKTSDGSIIYNLRDYGNTKFWAGLVDNTKYGNDDYFTLLPSDGNNKYSNRKINVSTNVLIPNIIQLNDESFDQKVQSSFRTIWDDEYIITDFSGKTFSSPYEYNLTYNEDNKSLKEYSLGENYRKAIDLIGTFSPSILEKFEDIFLNFASEELDLEIPQKDFSNVRYSSFQVLLKDIVTVKKDFDYTDTEDLFNKIKIKQKENLNTLSLKLLNQTEFLKITIGNPKELDSYIFESFYSQSGLTFNPYNVSQLSNQKYITLYVGENPDIGVNYYLEFFQVNNIELSQENVLTLRPLILIYAGYRKNGGSATSSAFREYVRLNIFDKNGQIDPIDGANNRLNFFLTMLTGKFSELSNAEFSDSISFVNGYNIEPLKIETYNFLKSFNDKWSAGNSIGQRLLMDEFLFLDKANVDIGDKVYLNIDRFINILSEKNEKANLYSAISMLIQNTGFDMRALPAYVNFYSPSINSNKVRFEASKNTASNIFGTFLEVDYQESSPKIVLQFIGPSSKRLADLKGKDYKFSDDSLNIGDKNNNPYMVTLPEVFKNEVLAKSNKVVAFEVNVGDQYQSIFKSVSLDQSTIKNTSESFVVTENIARSESGAGTYNVDIGLYDYYRTASYTCEVTCMGNVMIQPTMFFYLQNIPMFRGSYWITEVSHRISNNNIETVFRGSRIPRASLPDPSDSFISSYRPLLDKIINNALQVARTVPVTENTEKVITFNGKNYTINTGEQTIPTEKILENQVGLYRGIIPINGFRDSKYIQKVEYRGEQWLRAYVIRMGGNQYPIPLTRDMSIISSFRTITANPSKINWGMVDDLSTKQKFYSTNFVFENNITPDFLIGKKTVFLNPNETNNKPETIFHTYSLNSEQGLTLTGPINSGPSESSKAGIAMSYALMKSLNIHENQVIYFKIID